MTAPFTAQLRARRDALQVAPSGASTITVRVELPEKWDTVKAKVLPTQPVRDLKVAALEALAPGEAADAFVMKLKGWEVLNESATLTDVGARDGSIFLVTYRRRRAVR